MDFKTAITQILHNIFLLLPNIDFMRPITLALQSNRRYADIQPQQIKYLITAMILLCISVLILT